MKIDKHLLFVLVVIAIALLVALVIKYADALQHVWLWLVGLVGGISELLRRGWDKLNSLFAAPETIPAVTGKTNININPAPIFSETKTDKHTTEIKVLRYTDDGETTLGLLYIDGEFYCYTLEDTFREVKVPGKTRIPAGSYQIDFIKQLTPLTLTYRKTRDWFDYHLEIKNVPGFTGVYIHNGGTSEDTEGCLLIADGITANDATKMLTNSRQTFEEFYKLIGNRLRNNCPVNITLYNENWIDQLKQ